MTLTEARAGIGRSVVYRAPSGPSTPGTITAATAQWVVVCYRGCDVGKCTAPELLEFAPSTNGQVNLQRCSSDDTNRGR